MARIRFGILALGVLLLTALTAPAGEDALKKELAALNDLTGNDPLRGALKALIDNPTHAKKLLVHGLPAAKKKELSYNAAFVLALTASDLKDMKTAEAYFRVCMEQGAKLQSFEKLRQSYGLLIQLYFESRQYADCTRICKELLALNTDDDKERKVVGLMVNRRGEIEFREPRDRFDTAQQMRPIIYEIYVKATAKQGRHAEALTLVDNLIKKSDDWIDRQLRGWVLKEAGKLEDAATTYEGVIKEAANDDRFKPDVRDEYIDDVRYDLSNVYIELRKIDRASEHLEILLKRHPEKPIFYNDLGYVWADHDMKLEEAEKLIRKAIDLDRAERKKSKSFDPKTDMDKGAYLDSLGWVLFKRKNYKEAKTWLIKATEDKNAQHIEIYDHLGDVYLVLGERQAAIQAWQKGIEVATESRRDQKLKVSVEKKLENAKKTK